MHYTSIYLYIYCQENNHWSCLIRFMVKIFSLAITQSVWQKETKAVKTVVYIYILFSILFFS